MRVLILTQWYPPEPAMLLQELAQSLQDRGHEVTVLTGFPNYPAGQLYPGYSVRLRQRETLAGVPVVRVPLYPEHSQSGRRRALNYLSFALSSAAFGPWLVRRPDVLFVYHPPLTIGIPAFVLSRLWRVPFVYQIQDMWPETLSATGMFDNPRLLGWIGRFARWVYGKAHSILVISPGFRRNLLEKGVPPEKIHVVSNWVDPATYYRTQPDAQLAQTLGLAGRFNVMFAGNMGEAQGLETVIEAAKLLRDDPQIQFVLVGDGIALPRLQQLVEQHGLANVRFLGRYPAHEMPRLYALADALLVHLKDDPLFRITIPHKTLAYLGSGKPILAAVAGDVADLIDSIGAGVTCPPENPQALAAAVRALQSLSASERQAMGEKGADAAQARYSRDVMTGEIAAVLQQAMGGKA
ncbi:MAG TPA: glycosyltransferase family 4 protein [Anaerolineae bacterium]|nr:glycosyltransferase family 4 protein [Anaerolineae bacterium]